MCDKAVNICFFAFDFIPDQYETLEILFADQKHILAADLENVSLDNFDGDNLDRIIRIRFGWRCKF